MIITHGRQGNLPAFLVREEPMKRIPKRHALLFFVLAIFKLSGKKK